MSLQLPTLVRLLQVIDRSEPRYLVNVGQLQRRPISEQWERIIARDQVMDERPSDDEAVLDALDRLRDDLAAGGS